MANDTYSKTIGYLAWIFGFMGAHRFYYGKQITGAIWFFTLGLLGIGLLLVYLGIFGFHRFYMGKWITGLLYLCTIGLLGMGILYDFCTLNGGCPRNR